MAVRVVPDGVVIKVLEVVAMDRVLIIEQRGVGSWVRGVALLNTASRGVHGPEILAQWPQKSSLRENSRNTTVGGANTAQQECIGEDCMKMMKTLGTRSAAFLSMMLLLVFAVMPAESSEAIPTPSMNESCEEFEGRAFYCGDSPANELIPCEVGGRPAVFSAESTHSTSKYDATKVLNLRVHCSEDGISFGGISTSCPANALTSEGRVYNAVCSGWRTSSSSDKDTISVTGWGTWEWLPCGDWTCESSHWMALGAEITVNSFTVDLGNGVSYTLLGFSCEHMLTYDQHATQISSPDGTSCKRAE